jgi:hypothetical protein
MDDTPLTLYQALHTGLCQAAQYNQADATAPVAVLWTDAARQWEPLLPRLRAELPILTLGPYNPSTRTGPAIWLRCMIARTLAEADWPADAVPIFYLPGISRQELRAVDECPRALQPLAELQYRGVLWTHKNGRDWTIAGFLQGHDDLQIEVATDKATKDALLNALLKLADEPIAALRVESPLTAAKLNALLNPEPVRNLLLWMNDPAGQKAKLTEAEWAAFCGTCRHQFGFDPVKDGEVTAAQLLGKRDGVWHGVWNRFAEAPNRYPALPDLLRRARPTKDDLFHVPSSWPQDNEAQEEVLRKRLAGLKDALPPEARKQIRELEKTHGERRTWVWAELGMAPLACILQALITLADRTENTLGGITPNDMAAVYVAGGWQADMAVLDALAVKGGPDDVAAIKCAIAALYHPWLRESAEAFQNAVKHQPIPAASPATPISPKSGCCWLFADGLRYDVGQRLADALETSGLIVAREWQWTALPGVTPTAKPAVSPIAALLGPGPDFNCAVLEDSAKVTVEILRRELTKTGYAILGKDDLGSPTGAAWTECGALDTTGHNLGWRLALRIPDEVKEIAGRVRALLDAGWLEVRIVTDHGWLLLPSGLPKVDLPEHLTEERKGRCARLKPTATTDQQTVLWRWDKEVRIAMPPGIGCYKAGEEYEHGGLSVQECVTPVLTVRSAAPVGPAATISSVKWSRMRCRIQVTGGSDMMKVDLRLKPADAASSIAETPKALDGTGQASLMVPDDDRVGHAAVIVLLGSAGNILTQHSTIVGDH